MVPQTEATLKAEFPFTVPTPLHVRLMAPFEHGAGHDELPVLPPPAATDSTVDLVA
jgi:hypothetical protein